MIQLPRLKFVFVSLGCLILLGSYKLLVAGFFEISSFLDEKDSIKMNKKPGNNLELLKIH